MLEKVVNMYYRHNLADKTVNIQYGDYDGEQIWINGDYCPGHNYCLIRIVGEDDVVFSGETEEEAVLDAFQQILSENDNFL